jgi:hypothetical protein
MEINMKPFRIAATFAATLATTLVFGSAIANTSTTPKANTATTKYCHMERLYTASNDLVCNWAPTAAEACRDNTVTSRLPQSSVSEAPKKASRCPSGEWLVQVTTK